MSDKPSTKNWEIAVKGICFLFLLILSLIGVFWNIAFGDVSIAILFVVQFLALIFGASR